LQTGANFEGDPVAGLINGGSLTVSVFDYGKVMILQGFMKKSDEDT
jgi:hypothetical protein